MELIPTMLSIKDAAAVTGLSYSYIRSLVLQNKIVFIRSGRKVFINMEKFAEFLNNGGDS